MKFQEIVMQRYATRRFDGRTVPEETVRELLELVRFAPSALNLQPWRIRVVTDPAQKAALRPAAFDQEQVTTCSHLLVFCADPDYEGLIARLDALLSANRVPEEMRQMVLGMARQFTAEMPPEKRLAWSTAQTYLALGNALNGAKALGLDSCPMGGFRSCRRDRDPRDPRAARPGHALPDRLCRGPADAEDPFRTRRDPGLISPSFSVSSRQEQWPRIGRRIVGPRLRSGTHRHGTD